MAARVLLSAALLAGRCTAVGTGMLTAISPMHKSASVHIRKLLLHATDCIVDDNSMHHRGWNFVERCARPSFGNTSACSKGLTRFSRSPVALLATVARLRGCRAFGECRAMVHVRHPFDILVSMFDAWTSTATAEFNKSLEGKLPVERVGLTRRREGLRAGGIDAYVLSRMNQVCHPHLRYLPLCPPAEKFRAPPTWLHAPPRLCRCTKRWRRR